MLLSRIHLAKPIRNRSLYSSATARHTITITPAFSIYHRHITTSSAAAMSHAASNRPNVQTRHKGGISDPIKKDHQELEEYYHKIIDSKNEDEKTRWANQFTWELARHSVGEELVMYPRMREVLKDGDSLVDKDLREHQEVKEQLFKFQNMKSTDPSFEPLLRSMWAGLAQHMKEEEEIDLVQLELALTAEESVDLAKKFQLTKKFVPTRSHPSAPNQPPFETVVGLLTAPIDKLRDLFARFPKDN